MKHIRLSVLILLVAPVLWAQDMKLWYEQPAEEWTAGLPLGNGRLMAVVQGGVLRERIQLNDDTLWTGQPVKRDKPDGYKHLDGIRQLMFEGKYWEAEQLVIDKMQGFVLTMGMSTYQTLGDLELDFAHSKNAKVVDYYRELDLETGISTVRYEIDGVSYVRETFIIPVDQALVVRLSSDKKGELSLNAKLSRSRGRISHLGEGRLVMSGVAKPKTNPGWIGVSYETHLQVSAEGGTVSDSKNGIRVEDANTVTLRLVAATDFRGEDPSDVCSDQLCAALEKDYSELRSDHVEEHQRLFNRVELDPVIIFV